MSLSTLQQTHLVSTQQLLALTALTLALDTTVYNSIAMKFIAAAAAILALPLFVASSPLDARTDGPCTTGPAQCCQHTVNSNSAEGRGLLGPLLGLLGLGEGGSLIGINCSPIVIFGSGSGCSSSPVCCTDNGGAMSTGCTNINH